MNPLALNYSEVISHLIIYIHNGINTTFHHRIRAKRYLQKFYQKFFNTTQKFNIST